MVKAASIVSIDTVIASTLSIIVISLVLPELASFDELVTVKYAEVCNNLTRIAKSGELLKAYWRILSNPEQGEQMAKEIHILIDGEGRHKVELNSWSAGVVGTVRAEYYNIIKAYNHELTIKIARGP